MENHRRIIEVAKIAWEQNLQVVVSAMAPSEIIRAEVNKLAQHRIDWIYLETDENTCSQRGKGIYSSPQDGSSNQFLGPTSSESIKLHLNTSSEDVDLCKSRVFSELRILSE